jgi:hypothetical protein
VFDRLYDVTEDTKVSFTGFASESARYDFAVVYTDSFFGKPLVICMQTGKAALLCENDLENLDYLQHVFSVPSPKQAEELSLFLQQRIPAISSYEHF